LGERSGNGGTTSGGISEREGGGRFKDVSKDLGLKIAGRGRTKKEGKKSSMAVGRGTRSKKGGK